ncbi:hypothetical protein FS837_001030 [Tulasnella sp. UAMH 9824]|nr:hypothetical protein FS837_001030 [Tulasnella sp. UAMH 9824]
MSTENLNKNQKFNGGSAGYLASLEAAKTSKATDLPEVASNHQSDGTLSFKIHALAGHYTVHIVRTKPLHFPPLTGEGVGYAESLRDGDYSFAPDYFWLNGTTLDTLIEIKNTTSTWFGAGDQTVAIVTGPDGKNLLHTMPFHFEIQSGSALPITWSVDPVP